MDDETKFDEVIELLPSEIKNMLASTPKQIKSIAFEIRLRANREIMLTCPNKIFNLKRILTAKNLNDCFLSICNYSVHSHINEIKQGFITLQGGHRAGLCATAVYDDETGKIANLKQISSINIRISRQVENASKELFDELHNNVGKLLIVGPPSSGKTTILKDIAKNLSLTNIVSIVDTRGEIAACSNSIAQNDVANSDVFSFWNRSDGVLAAIKTMSPEYIICDEIGSKTDLKAVKACVGSGVELISTAHGENLEEIKKRPILMQILKTGAFENVAILQSRNNPCKLKYIIKVSDFFENNWNVNFSNVPHYFGNRPFDEFKIKSNAN